VKGPFVFQSRELLKVSSECGGRSQVLVARRRQRVQPNCAARPGQVGEMVAKWVLGVRATGPQNFYLYCRSCFTQGGGRAGQFDVARTAVISFS